VSSREHLVVWLPLQLHGSASFGRGFLFRLDYMLILLCFIVLRILSCYNFNLCLVHTFGTFAGSTVCVWNPSNSPLASRLYPILMKLIVPIFTARLVKTGLSGLLSVNQARVWIQAVVSGVCLQFDILLPFSALNDSFIIFEIVFYSVWSLCLINSFVKFKLKIRTLNTLQK
jgi:hypothetical protein